MKAILSDIHGNLEALDAVLQDLGRCGAEEIYCLGDLVGYGPNPRECVDLAMEWDVVLRGACEGAAVVPPSELDSYITSPIRARSLRWSHLELDAPEPNSQVVPLRWGFLRALRKRHREGDYLFVHASPRKGPYTYKSGPTIYIPDDMDQIFACVDHVCFMGHTHVPGVLTEDGRFRTPGQLRSRFRVNCGKTLVHVGSVGQPHDGDWRASYALVDGDTVWFRRAEYDIRATMQKIRANPHLDDFLADRLQDGL